MRASIRTAPFGFARSSASGSNAHVNKPALGVALASAVLTVPAVYAVMRGYEVFFVAEPNPAVITASVKIATFWRLWIGVYVAPIVGIGAFEVARRDLARAARMLEVAVIAVAALAGIQGLFLP